ncbi:MAG TPA: ABC transporter permease [Deinococcales bacterium]|nr:ABC transporter permease [Deinococcales bacterium]
MRSGLLALEYRKLLGFRSFRVSLGVAFLLPFLLSFAPDGELAKVIGTNLVLVSGWQVPGLSLYIAMQFALPLLVAVIGAELIGGEVAWGTLAPLLLRPVSRRRVILAKLAVALTFPLALLAALLVGGTLAGLRFGLASFAGGTGLGPGAFMGLGLLSPLGAMGELGRAYLLAGLTLAPVAALAVLCGVLFLNTASAALTTVSAVILMRLLVVFPAITPLLLTSHLDAYAPGRDAARSLVLLGIYAAGLCAAATMVFERKDL